MTKMDVMSINIHRMFEYLFCADESSSFLNLRFENDVKMYGTQTSVFLLKPLEGKIKNGNRIEIFTSYCVLYKMLCQLFHVCTDKREK